MNRISCGICAAFCALLLSMERADAQGTITFDGPPFIPPGATYGVQSYRENGVWFAPIPGNHAFSRRGSNPPAAFWPDNGTAYVLAGLGDSLMFGLDNGSEFSLVSMDLAEWSTDYPGPWTFLFVGYRQDGTTVTQSFTTDGIIDGTGPLADFETFQFGSQWSGLTRVEIPTYGWSLDNLYVSIPEPGSGALIILGVALLGLRCFKRKQRSL